MATLTLMAICRAFPSLLLVFILLAGSSFTKLDATSEGDALFKMMQQWKRVFPTWVSGGDPCAQNWTGVTCSNGNVVELNVTNTGIIGSLPEEIGLLKYLEVLDISNLYDSVPLGKVQNVLSGPFPDTLSQCTALKSFNASNMQWNTSFPAVLATLTNLEEVYLSYASLTGTIPDTFFNLAKLRYLFIGPNDLYAQLDKFARLQNLVLLSMNGNTFRQQLPIALESLQKLEYFNCHTCSLYGPLPSEYGNLSNLRNLTLHRNNLTGSIPEAWSNLTKLGSFRIDQNYLSGSFPKWLFTSLPRLAYLSLSKNSFSGTPPDFSTLEGLYNVSYTYWTLKWDCNYLNGASPCTPTNPCSNKTDDLINSKNPVFDFDSNCYNNSGQQDLQKVQNNCDQYHSNDVSCSDFYSNLDSGQCPACPSGQVRSKLVMNGPNGNCVCTIAPQSGKHHGVSVGAVLGIVLGTVALCTVVIMLIMYKRRKHFAFLDIFTVKDPNEGAYWEIPSGVEKFSLNHLARITHNFSDANMIGQGGFGKVFVGTLENGKMVAIKRATPGGLQGTMEFKNEITLLSRLHHRHLVKLEGFCDEENLQILVYEFMKRGNLHSHLLGHITTTPLHWYKRLEIAFEVAQGLEYLHSYADPPVIHRDVKPTNILLDDNMMAKLADFGISKVSPEYDTHVSTRPAGTAGYLDPDYFLRRQLTTGSDVYAYGVVILELVTGQEAIDHSRLEEFNLVEWVKKRFITRGVVSIVDPLIEHEYSPEAFAAMALLGLKCSSFNRDERPSMREVLSTLAPFMKTPTPVRHSSDPDMIDWSRKKKGAELSSFEIERKGSGEPLLDVDQRTVLSQNSHVFSQNSHVFTSSDINTQRSSESEYGPHKSLSMSQDLGPR